MFRYTAQIDGSLPIIAIDIGYSATSRSCGLAVSGDATPMVCTFGECLAQVEQRLRDVGPHLLLLEAVLSTYHQPNGNPAIRGDFERGRGWYHGPGVTTFAAALRFLTELDRQLPKSIHGIPIVEGFLSYKTTKTDHGDDAAKMLRDFSMAERFNPHPKSEPLLASIEGVPEVRRYNPPPHERKS